jgi:hypothetical protein
MAEEKSDPKLLTELVGLGKSLGKLTARRAREWADEARGEVLTAVREAREQVDRGLEEDGAEPPASDEAAD